MAAYTDFMKFTEANLRNLITLQDESDPRLSALSQAVHTMANRMGKEPSQVLSELQSKLRSGGETPTFYSEFIKNNNLGQHAHQLLSQEDAQKYPKLDALSQLEHHVNELLGNPNQPVLNGEIKELDAQLLARVDSRFF